MRVAYRFSCVVPCCAVYVAIAVALAVLYSCSRWLRDSKSDVFIGFSTCNQSLAHLACFVARSEKWKEWPTHSARKWTRDETRRVSERGKRRKKRLLFLPLLQLTNEYEEKVCKKHSTRTLFLFCRFAYRCCCCCIINCVLDVTVDVIYSRPRKLLPMKEKQQSEQNKKKRTTYTLGYFCVSFYFFFYCLLEYG